MERSLDGFDKEYDMIEALVDLCNVSHIDDYFEKIDKNDNDVKFYMDKDDNKKEVI